MTSVGVADRESGRSRSLVTSLPKQRGLSPVNGPIQDGCDAVITAPTSRSSHYPRAQRYEDQYLPEFCWAVSSPAGTVRRRTKGG